VRFYEDEEALASAVAEYLAQGFARGEAGLALLAPRRGASVRERLAGLGHDAEALQRSGQLVIVDASETLAGLMTPAGRPDEDAFMRLIGGLVAKTSVGRAGLRAYGEMAALLWEDRNPEAALALEKLWNKLGRTVAFSLLCAYPIRGLGGPGQGRLSARICDEHGRILPAESYPDGAPPEERQRALAGLQAKTQRLEAEIAERARIEEALRRSIAELEERIEGMRSRHEAAARHEAALAESESRFRAMADSAPVLIWLSAPDGRRLYVNRPWLEFTGMSEAEELARGMDGVHPEDRAQVEAIYAKAVDARAAFRSEFRYRRADGAWRWMLNTGTPRLGPDGSFLGFIGTCMDVTEHREIEEQLRQAQKMEAVGRLAGGIAHDFNNLLTAINGYSEMAMAQAGETGSMREFLAEIKRAGERAASLTQQLLAYSRKQILAPVTFDLNETVADMDRMLRRLIGEHIRMECELERGLGLIQADPGQVQQIILNLVLNARDAMPEGGTLTLETANVVPDAGPDHSSRPHAMLAVRDTGSGMTPEVRARIFEPFYTTKAVGKGTGLGLSSAYGIVRQSGGFITVESEPGRGSAFKVHFPIVEKEAAGNAGGAGPAPLPPAGRGGTILLVEDEEAVRRFMLRILESEGYHVLEAKDGAAALLLGEKCRRIDLLLADMVLPHMNGPALADRLKPIHPGLGILFISGYADSVFLPGGALEPGAAFLQKPFAQPDLLAKVRELMAARAPA
jgi:PAS domain S-box-containing protein